MQKRKQEVALSSIAPRLGTSPVIGTKRASTYQVGQPCADPQLHDCGKRMEAGSGRDLADIEMPVLRLLEIEEGFGRHPHAGGIYKASAANLRKRLTPPT
jgi:hypothetical protein